MAHPILYGEKDLAIISPTINLTTETATGFEINGNVTAPNLYAKTVATPQVVTISPTGIVGSAAASSLGGVTFGAFGAAPNANAGVISAGGVITLEPASGAQPGGVSTTVQTFAGAKTFSSAVQLGTTLQDSAGNILLSYTGTTNPQTVTVGNAANTTQLVANGIYGNTPASSQVVTIGPTGALGSQLGGLSTFGTITGTPTVDTGAITGYQTRGVATTPPIVNWVLTTRTGGPSSVTIRIPAVQVTATTGSPTTINVCGATALPASCWPGISAVNIATQSVNNTAKATGTAFVGTTGIISLQTTAGTAFTNTFGLAQDHEMTWLIVAS
jgi:hypothetical protein